MHAFKRNQGYHIHFQKMYVITLQNFLEGLQSAIRLAVAVSRLIDCSLDDPATICCELNGCRLFVALQHTLIRKQKLLFQKDAHCFYLKSE